MISSRLEQLLVEQIGHEFTASQHYLGIAAYFGLQSLDKFADIFYKQSEEEREHALKIVHFLVDVDAAVAFPAIEEAKPDYESPLAAVQWALDNEKQVTKLFHNMAQASLEEKDYTTFQFLQWFIEEQVEEEASMQKLVDLVTTESNPFRAEILLYEESEK
jgi:bacterioferritin B